MHDELEQIEKVRENIENEYRSLTDLYLNKQKEKQKNDEERIYLDNEYNRLINEINYLTEAIDSGKRHWFSVRFELETYRRLLDLEITKPVEKNNHISIPNGTEEKGMCKQQRQSLTVKRSNLQRSISKTGEIKRTNNKISFKRRFSIDTSYHFR